MNPTRLLTTAFLAMPTSVWAQTVVVPTVGANGWTADLNNALTIILGASAVAVAGIITAAGTALARKLGVDFTAQQKANLNADVTTALNVGITQNLPAIEAAGWSAASVRKAILADATAFLQQRFPDQATAITNAAQPPSASDPKVSAEAAISKSLAARLPDAISVAAASPGTPAVATT
jgi:hypothetical protein